MLEKGRSYHDIFILAELGKQRLRLVDGPLVFVGAGHLAGGSYRFTVHVHGMCLGPRGRRWCGWIHSTAPCVHGSADGSLDDLTHPT